MWCLKFSLWICCFGHLDTRFVLVQLNLSFDFHSTCDSDDDADQLFVTSNVLINTSFKPIFNVINPLIPSEAFNRPLSSIQLSSSSHLVTDESCDYKSPSSLRWTAQTQRNIEEYSLLITDSDDGQFIHPSWRFDIWPLFKHRLLGG